jgi:hypothetical protein
MRQAELVRALTDHDTQRQPSSARRVRIMKGGTSEPAATAASASRVDSRSSG